MKGGRKERSKGGQKDGRTEGMTEGWRETEEGRYGGWLSNKIRKKGRNQKEGTKRKGG